MTTSFDPLFKEVYRHLVIHGESHQLRALIKIDSIIYKYLPWKLQELIFAHYNTVVDSNEGKMDDTGDDNHKKQSQNEKDDSETSTHPVHFASVYSLIDRCPTGVGDRLIKYALPVDYLGADKDERSGKRPTSPGTPTGGSSPLGAGKLFPDVESIAEERASFTLRTPYRLVSFHYDASMHSGRSNHDRSDESDDADRAVVQFAVKYSTPLLLIIHRFEQHLLASRDQSTKERSSRPEVQETGTPLLYQYRVKDMEVSNTCTICCDDICCGQYSAMVLVTPREDMSNSHQDSYGHKAGSGRSGQGIIQYMRDYSTIPSLDATYIQLSFQVGDPPSFALGATTPLSP